MSSGSSEDRRRRKRRLADLDAGELEEGECAPGDHSSSDTEDYYNRDHAASSGGSEETISDLDDATASSAAPNHKSSSTAPNHRHKSSASAAAANHNGGGGGARPYSVLANRYGGGARASLTAAYYHYGRASASSASANLSFAAAAMRACRVCGKEFSSEKAVCGHMQVHAQEALHGAGKEPQQGNGKGKKKVKKERGVAVAGGWGVTGRRGCSGWGTSTDTVIVKASPSAEPDHASMDIVPAEPKIVYAPTPVAFAMPEDVPSEPMESARTNLSGESSSKRPMPDDDMDIAAAEANPVPPTEPVVHQQAAAAPAPPPPSAGKQAQVVRHKRAPRPSAGRQNPDGYRCPDPTCNAWYSNHQALGGHVAGHKNKRLAAEGVPQDGAGPSSSGGGSRAAKPHTCLICGKVYSKGVQLGGHMRKHFEGKIVPKRKPRLIEPPPPPADVAAGQALCRPADAHADDLTLALPIKAELQSLAPAVDAGQQAPAAAAEGTSEPSSPGPRATGRVILFGIDIGLGVQTPPAQEGSPATKDSSAFTGEHTEQQ